MKAKVDWPYCDGTAVLKSETREITYKQTPVSVNSHFYKCELCQEEFTTTETDTQTMMDGNTRSGREIEFLVVTS